jgi:hypothetical protein
LIKDIINRNYSEGASTITQQYVKNVYFNQENTIKRKIIEAIIAIQIERNYTKDKILEMYLNTVNFGAGSYGIEKAAQYIENEFKRIGLKTYGDLPTYRQNFQEKDIKMFNVIGVLEGKSRKDEEFTHHHSNRFDLRTTNQARRGTEQWI